MILTNTDRPNDARNKHETLKTFHANSYNRFKRRFLCFKAATKKYNAYNCRPKDTLPYEDTQIILYSYEFLHHSDSLGLHHLRYTTMFLPT